MLRDEFPAVTSLGSAESNGGLEVDSVVIAEIVVVVGVVAVGIWALGKYLDHGQERRQEKIQQSRSDDDDDLVGSR
jgi:hypothetical protein